MTYDGLVADRSDLGKLRIFLDLDSPTLIVCKMPVESIELMDFHYIKISLDCVHIKEMT